MRTDCLLFQLPKRTILTTDWERPLFYLHRVKSLTVEDDYLFETSDCFEALSLCHPGAQIFPNLQKLHWRPEPWTAFHHVRLFLAPQIKDLHLGSIHLRPFEPRGVLSVSGTGECVYSSRGRIHPIGIRLCSRFHAARVSWCSRTG